MTKTLLAIDTSTENCSAALSYGDQVLQRAMESPREHSQRILPFVEALLSEAGIRLSDVDGIVAGVGPGSFTGVRIGVSVAQGLAFSQACPVYPVSSLQALAQQAIRRHSATTVLASIDARMQEVYYAAYKNQQGTALALTEPAVCQPSASTFIDALADKESWRQGTLATAGTGWETYRQVLLSQMPSTIIETSDCRLPLAEDMLSLVQAGQIASCHAVDLEPLYVRNEVTWKKLPGR